MPAMVRAALIMILGMSLIPLGDTAGKFLTDSHDVSPVFVAWTRVLLGAALILPFVAPDARAPRLFADWRIWLRAVLTVGGILSILTALRTEPLPNVFGAFFVGPAVSAILSVIFLGERLSLARAVLLGLGFAGVLLIVRPGVGMTPGLLFAVQAGCFYGTYLFTNRWLIGVASPNGLVVGQLVVGAAILTPLALMTDWPEIDTLIAGLVVLSAAASVCGNLLLVVAYRMAEATRLAPLVYFQLVAATAYGWLIFGHLPNLWTSLGLALILVSGAGAVALRR